jgi:hypothetical protein
MSEMSECAGLRPSCGGDDRVHVLMSKLAKTAFLTASTELAGAFA